MSCQKPAKRAYKQNHENTETFKKEVYPSIKKLANAQNAEIYFGNESGINNQAYNPMGYAPKNCPTVVKFVTSMETVNMMSAVSPNGALKFMLYEETTTQQKLIEFMTRLEKERQKDKVLLF
jgi:hypothetical protein